MVLQKLEGGLLTITMNRPERKNALNPEMVVGLVEAARRAADDPEVRAVLFKGAGGSFCVGGNVVGSSKRQVTNESVGQTRIARESAAACETNRNVKLIKERCGYAATARLLQRGVWVGRRTVGQFALQACRKARAAQWFFRCVAAGVVAVAVVVDMNAVVKKRL